MNARSRSGTEAAAGGRARGDAFPPPPRGVRVWPVSPAPEPAPPAAAADRAGWSPRGDGGWLTAMVAAAVLIGGVLLFVRVFARRSAE